MRASANDGFADSVGVKIHFEPCLDARRTMLSIGMVCSSIVIMALPLHRDDEANYPNSFIAASVGLIESVPLKPNQLPSAGFCRAPGFNNSELRARLQRGARRL